LGSPTPAAAPSSGATDRGRSGSLITRTTCALRVFIQRWTGLACSSKSIESCGRALVRVPWNHRDLGDPVQGRIEAIIAIDSAYSMVAGARIRRRYEASGLFEPAVLIEKSFRTRRRSMTT
jgi:hypothetical protein